MTELYIESDLYRYIVKNTSKYLEGKKIESVNIKNINKDKNFYKYYNHSGDSREKKCKDDDDLRKNYFRKSGDFVNMYCFDEKKPIYYNTIYDSKTGILKCGNVGNKN